MNSEPIKIEPTPPLARVNSTWLGFVAVVLALPVMLPLYGVLVFWLWGVAGRTYQWAAGGY